MPMRFTLNGKEITTDKEKKLLSFLRDDMHLMGTKDGCSEGICGTCTVIIDGKARKSCTIPLSKVEGKNVITIEGLTEKEKEIYSYAFGKAGAVQCGFCTPGMVMSAKALLDENNNPSEEEIRKAIRGNLCRCTGYEKIVRGIELAAKILRGECSLEEENKDGAIGDDIIRLDATDKVLGRALYADDLRFDDIVYVSAIRSPYPKALIKKIDTSGIEGDEHLVGIIRKADVPFNMHGHLTADWPVLYGEGDVTSYLGDALILIAADSEEELERLKKEVRIDAEKLEGVFSAEEALKDENIVHFWEKSNLYREEKISRGDVDKAFSDADLIITRHFSTPVTEHAFMEPECAVAIPDGDGVHLFTSGQSVYDERRECARMLKLPEKKVRVTSMTVGGGFGGKEDMSVQHHAALASYILKRKVKVSLSRSESLLVHPKRHPMELEISLALNKGGKILGLKEDILTDTGAYASLGGPVLQRACTHAGGPYDFQSIYVRGRAVYTNNIPNGAFRGFGVTQSCFAIESIIDEAAEELGIDPFDIRMMNVVHPGASLPNGQIAGKDTAIEECLRKIEKYYRSAKYKGLAIGFKNAGIGMGVPDVGRALLKAEDGKIHIRTSAACMGQGLKTMALQVAITATGLERSLFVVDEPDTLFTPDSGTSTASRQTAFTGEAVRIAAEKLRSYLEGKDLSAIEGMEFYGEFGPKTDPLGSNKEHPVSHLAYSYSAQLAILSDEGRIEKIVAVSDAGTVINPISISGQMEGGIATGMGFALTENFREKDGYPIDKFGTLGLLRSTDMPEIIVEMVHGKGKGPSTYGAKGIGELAAIPTAPAIRNAYFHFDGKKRYSLPLEDTPYSRKK